MPVRQWPVRSATTTAPRLRLFVLFTDAPRTRAALHQARQLSRDLDAAITLLALQHVPYPLPLDQPPVDDAFLARQLAELATVDTTSVDLPVEIEICRCREARSVSRALFPPGAILLIGTGSWFHRKFHKLAAQLTEAGCSVIQTRNLNQ